MNLDMVDRNSVPEEFACIWQSKLVGIITIETEKMWIHFSCEVFVAVGCRGIECVIDVSVNTCCKLELVFLEKLLQFSGRQYFEMESLYQTESFLTACISLVHEPDKLIPSCTNSQKELRRCCSPIGHNNTKHFLCPIRSQHSLDRLEMVRWESVPGGFSACAWKLSSRLFPRPDWLLLGLRGCHVPSDIITWNEVHHGILFDRRLRRNRVVNV